MNIPEWMLYCGAVIIFWIGFFTCAMLSSSKEEDIRAAILGELGATSKRKHGEGVFQDHDPEDQTLVVGEILREKKARTRTVEATENGTQKRVSKNV